MSRPFDTEIHLPTQADTTLLGQRIAALLRPGDVLLLKGPIGAGKTHLARAIIQARLAKAGLHENVPSPTYTLVQVYSDGQAEIWHADLYRLTDSGEIVELGLEDAFNDAICLIEWPDRLGGAVPANALWLELATEGDARRISLTSDDAGWSRIRPALETAA